MYGEDPVDIARFGVLPACSGPGRHRCVQPKINRESARPTSTPDRRGGEGPGEFFAEVPAHPASAAPLLSVPDQNIRLVPCVDRGRCPGELIAALDICWTLSQTLNSETKCQTLHLESRYLS